MAKILMNQLDPDLLSNITSGVKEKMFLTYGHVPCDRQKIVEGLDDEFVEGLSKEIRDYYDGLFDDDPVEINISKEEYAELV